MLIANVVCTAAQHEHAQSYTIISHHAPVSFHSDNNILQRIALAVYTILDIVFVLCRRANSIVLDASHQQLNFTYANDILECDRHVHTCSQHFQQ